MASRIRETSEGGGDSQPRDHADVARSDRRIDDLEVARHAQGLGKLHGVERLDPFLVLQRDPRGERVYQPVG